jgi:hypothetical protein
MLQILRKLSGLAEEKGGVRVVPFTIDVATDFSEENLEALEALGWVKLEPEEGLITILPEGEQKLEPLTLAKVLDALLSNSTPIAKGDSGWCGLVGQGYITDVGPDVYVIDVADPISVQVIDGDSVLIHAWRLVIEELEA